MNQEEIWKPIKGYEGYYEISNKSRVRSVERQVNHQYGTRTVKEKIIKGSLGKRGYLEVSLCKGSTKRHYTLHKLVMEHFVPNPENKPCIDHIDGNKLNNQIENLRWVTYKENTNNPITLNRIRSNTHSIFSVKKRIETNRMKGNHSAPKTVYQYQKDGKLVARYDSLSAASRATGIQLNSIWLVVDKLHLTAGDYIWTSKERDGAIYCPRPIHNKRVVVGKYADGRIAGEWSSVTETAKELNASYSSISRSLKSHKPFRGICFEYKENL